MTEEREKELRARIAIEDFYLDADEAIECLDAIAEMRREISELWLSFDLYDNAMRRGTVYYHEKHPEDESVWPDSGKLACWLMEEITSLKAANARLRAVVVAVREYGAAECDDDSGCDGGWCEHISEKWDVVMEAIAALDAEGK